MASIENFQPIQLTELDAKSAILGTILIFFAFFFTFVFILILCTRCNRALSWRRTAASVGLDAAAIGSLPTFSYELRKDKSTGGQEMECCICLSIFEDGDEVKELPRCGHGFHSECVDKWLRNRTSCPLCREQVVLQGTGGNSVADEV